MPVFSAGAAVLQSQPHALRSKATLTVWQHLESCPTVELQQAWILLTRANGVPVLYDEFQVSSVVL
jgi:hypothetical protein